MADGTGGGVPPVAILLAKAGIAAAPMQEMRRLADQLEASGRVAKAVVAFSEQGSPSLKDVALQLRDDGWREILILPMLVPMEPSFHTFVGRTLQRWHIEAGGDWPVFKIGRGLSEVEDAGWLLDQMMDSALAGAPTPTNPKAATEGSGHLRNAQVERKLVDHGDGMRSAKTTCLGPCALGPVVQVYPEGTFYGGVDEAGMDRIIDEHLLEGRVVEDLAYAPSEGKQRLRAKSAAEKVS